MRKLWPIAVLLAAVALSGPSHAQPSGGVQISEEARRQFAVGVSLLDDPSGARYEEAYEAFRRAYAESPTPKILSNLGLCAMMLERDGEAIDSYRRYLTEVKDVDPREREKIEKDLQVMEARGGTLRLTLSPAEGLLVDTRVPHSGAQVVNRYPYQGGAMTLRLRAGQHRIEVYADGYQSAELALVVESNDQSSKEVRLQPLQGEPEGAPVAPAAATTPATPASSTPPPSSPTPRDEAGGGVSSASIVALVLTGALAVGAGVTGGLALKAKGDYESYQTGGDRADAESVRSTGETLNIVTDVLIGTAAAGAVVTLVLLLTTSGGDEPEDAAVRVLPGLVEGQPGMVLQATF